MTERRGHKQLDTLRIPRATSASTSRSMRSNKSSGTKPELLLSRLLRKRISKSDLPGTPDFVFPRKKMVVFLNGCFWHRCPKCAFRLPKRNRQFWAMKFERNRVRDQLVKRKLESMGWRVIKVWEHELKQDPMSVKEKILNQRFLCFTKNGSGYQ